MQICKFASKCKYSGMQVCMHANKRYISGMYKASLMHTSGRYQENISHTFGKSLKYLRHISAKVCANLRISQAFLHTYHPNSTLVSFSQAQFKFEVQWKFI